MRIKSSLLFLSICTLLGTLTSCAQEQQVKEAEDVEAHFHFGPGPEAEEQESTDIRT